MPSVELTFLENLILDYYKFFGAEVKLGIQQCKDEIEQLINYFGLKRFDSFCEVGSDEGGSLWLYSHLFVKKGGKVISIQRPIKPVFNTVVEKLREDFEVEVIARHSNDVELDNNSIGLVHIDANHEYESVKNDFEKFYEITKDTIFLHDTLLWPGCIKFRKELELSYPCITFRGHDLISKFWGINKYDRLSTGITLINK